jgi:hypothetical protein
VTSSPRTVLLVALAAAPLLVGGSGELAAAPLPAPAAPAPLPESGAGDPAVVDTDVPGPATKVRLRPLPGGTAIVRGRGEVHGTRGPLVRYTVEVQRSLTNRSRRAAALHEHVERVFGDADRGWTGLGQRRLQRMGSPKNVRIRIVLGTRGWVDRTCGRVGLRTVGRYSCWTGRYAALNLYRWRTGQKGFDSVTDYRTYLINHEFGHALGYQHRTCPWPGALARAMLPQSRSLYGCRPNGWPYR